MSTKDSEGDKLVASIRKAKSRSTTSVSDAAATPPKKASAKKRARPAAKPAGKSVGGASENATRKAQLVDLFQHGRRVWPD